MGKQTQEQLVAANAATVGAKAGTKKCLQEGGKHRASEQRWPEAPSLRELFQDDGGKLGASELAQQVYQNQPANSELQKALERLLKDREITLTWDEFEAFHAEGKAFHASRAGRQPSPPKALADPNAEEMMAISPEVARYAHYKCDLVLVQRFCHLLYKSILQDLYKDADAGITTHAEAKKRCVQAIKHDDFYKNVLQSVRLMHLCGYDYDDVVLVLGYATVYFPSTFSSIGKKMSPNEAAHVVVLLIYLAHAFLLDKTCPLRIWQKHIFSKYCTLKVLDAALFRLLQLRKDFKLRISEEEESMALLGLSGLLDTTGRIMSSEEDREEDSSFQGWLDPR